MSNYDVKNNRYYGTFSLKEKVLSGLDREKKKRNLYDERLITNWADIVGEYAVNMVPCKIIFDGHDDMGRFKKILFCSTSNRQFSVEFVFYKKQIIDMLNVYFGDHKSIFSDVKLKVI